MMQRIWERSWKRWRLKGLTSSRSNYLLPPSVQARLPESYLIRYMVEVAEMLDLSALERADARRGSDAYHPAMLLSLPIYGDATGTIRTAGSSGRPTIRWHFGSSPATSPRTTAPWRASGTVLANSSPTVQHVACENQLSRFDTASLDGTKIHANASQHSELSYGYADKTKAQLKAEVQEILKLAEAADKGAVAGGVDLPVKIKRREERLAAIAAAKTKIEVCAKERFEREQADYEAKRAKRQAKRTSTGKKPCGTPPKAPLVGPRAEDQANFSDCNSRIMKVAGGGFEQCYKEQAAVDTELMLVAASHLTTEGNDKEQVETILERVQALPDELNQPEKLLADADFNSERSVQSCHDSGRSADCLGARFPPRVGAASSKRLRRSRCPPPMSNMNHGLKTQANRAAYAIRKQTLESVFGITKSVMGFRKFLLRGGDNVRNKWTLVCLA